jgi:hypothetical protein
MQTSIVIFAPSPEWTPDALVEATQPAGAGPRCPEGAGGVSEPTSSNTRARGYVKERTRSADNSCMDFTTLIALGIAGLALTLYVMRRRSRLGRRSPKF